MKLNFKKILCMTLCFCFFSSVRIGLCKVETSSPSYFLGDFETGTTLLKQNENERRPIASVTKIMTLLLTFEEIEKGNLSPDEKITASANASKMGGSQIYLKENEEMTLDTLIKSVFVASANDSCVALAEKISGTEESFVEKMNEKARELGLENTFFKNPHGLDEDGHYSCAYDLFVISRELMKYDIQKYTTIWQDTIRNGEFTLTNTNKLIRFYPGATGLKTGSTSKAGYCMSATAKKGNTEFIAVVLGAETSKDRFNDAKALLNYGFSQYKTLTLAKKSEKVGECDVPYGKIGKISVFPKENVSLLIKSGDKSEIKKRIETKEAVAPVKKGEIAGTLYFEKDGKEIKKVELVYGEDLEKKSWLDTVRDFIVS